MIEFAPKSRSMAEGVEALGQPERQPVSADVISRFEGLMKGAPNSGTSMISGERSHEVSMLSFVARSRAEDSGSALVAASRLSSNAAGRSAPNSPTEWASRAVTTLENVSRHWHQGMQNLLQTLAHPKPISLGRNRETQLGSGSNYDTVGTLSERNNHWLDTEAKFINAMSAKNAQLFLLNYKVMTRGATMQVASATAGTITKGERRLTERA